MRMGKARFDKLFEPGQIGMITLRNRFVMPPMATGYSRDGYVTEQLKGYYEKRAKGGAGLVIVEATCVESRVGRLCIGPGGKSGLCIDDDRFIPGLMELARTIQRAGAKAAIQLVHAGSQANLSITREQPVAPSPIPWSIGESSGQLPRELTPGEIGEIVACFSQAAGRAKKAGFDGVEIHSAHGYLIAQFLSPISNQRQDAYGGDLKNRARFLLEIIKAIRKSVGQIYPVWCRINGEETGVANSTMVDTLRELARMLQNSGVNAISVSGRIAARPYFSPPGYFVPFAETVKKMVNIPVITAGKISPELGARILEEKKVDLIGMGRVLIADPELPNKVASGKVDDIVPCIGCLECIESVVIRNETLRCTVNPAVGREKEHSIELSDRAKKVLVIGGGPAGMEAARVAALRGHQVSLWDRGDKLGGQMLLASKPPYKGSITSLTNYLVAQITKLSIKTELRKEATPAMVHDIKPDVVIVATGALPFVPEIPGVDSTKVVTAEAVLSGQAEVGTRVVIIGGELVGCETALFLAEKGCKVIITKRGLEIATNVTNRVRYALLDILTAKEVMMLTGVRYEGITDEGLIIKDKTSKRRLIQADTIVLAAGAKPNRQQVESLKDNNRELYLIGDAKEPRGIEEAISEGYHIGRKI